MFENKPKVSRAILLSLLGAGLLAGSSGIVMSAKKLVVTVHASNCTGADNCSSTSDCGSNCHCNNPQNSTGTCKGDDLGC